jgi:hypothetical protein
MITSTVIFNFDSEPINPVVRINLDENGSTFCYLLPN